MMGKGKRAFTLVELMVVITLIALVLSLSLYAVISINRANRLKATAGTLRSMVRKARNTARQEQGMGVLFIAPRQYKVKVATTQLVGFFHFEKDMVSSENKGQTVYIRGGGEAGLIGKGTSVLPSPGHLGNAIYFPQKESLLEFPSNPLLNPNFGLFVDFWVRVDLPPPITGTNSPPTRSDFPLLSKDQSYLLRLTPSRQIEVGLRGEDSAGNTIDYFVATYPKILPEGEWTHIEMRFYRGNLEIVVNGIPRKFKPLEMTNNSDRAPVKLNRTAAPLVVGGGFLPLRMDELRIQAVVESDVLEYSRQYTLQVEGAVPYYGNRAFVESDDPLEDKEEIDEKKLAKGPDHYRIYFNARGGLDTRYHSGPVRIKVGIPERPGDSSETSLSRGTVERKEAGKKKEKKVKWKQVIYLGVAMSGALLGEERAKNLEPGQAQKRKESDRKQK